MRSILLPSNHLFFVFIALGTFLFASMNLSYAATCGKESRKEIAKLTCGERIALAVNKVCATTTIQRKKTQMVAVEIEAIHPNLRSVEFTIYEKGSLGGSMKRLIREKGKNTKAGKPFAIMDQSYNKEGKGGFKKAWVVTDQSGSKIDEVFLKIQLSKGGEVCKKKVNIGKLWGTKWWDDSDSERDRF